MVVLAIIFFPNDRDWKIKISFTLEYYDYPFHTTYQGHNNQENYKKNDITFRNNQNCTSQLGTKAGFIRKKLGSYWWSVWYVRKRHDSMNTYCGIVFGIRHVKRKINYLNPQEELGLEKLVSFFFYSLSSGMERQVLKYGLK